VLDVAEQGRQQGTVDDLDAGSAAGTGGQQGTAAVELGRLTAVLGVDRLIDDLFRELALGGNVWRAEHAHRVVNAGRLTGPSTLSRIRGLPLCFVPLTTVLTHWPPPDPKISEPKMLPSRPAMRPRLADDSAGLGR
jgi:hypothetical protein